MTYRQLLAHLCMVAALLPGLGQAVRAAPPLKVAFVDTGNTGRSISAETMARIYAADHHYEIWFISRGVDVNPYERQTEMNAQTLWQKRGIDLSGHRAEQLTEQDVKYSHLILTLTEKHKAAILSKYPGAAGKVFVLTEYAVGRSEDIAGPWRKPMAVYETMLAELEKYVPPALEKAHAGEGELINPPKVQP